MCKVKIEAASKRSFIVVHDWHLLFDNRIFIASLNQDPTISFLKHLLKALKACWSDNKLWGAQQPKDGSSATTCTSTWFELCRGVYACSWHDCSALLVEFLWDDILSALTALRTWSIKTSCISGKARLLVACLFLCSALSWLFESTQDHMITIVPIGFGCSKQSHICTGRCE